MHCHRNVLYRKPKIAISLNRRTCRVGRNGIPRAGAMARCLLPSAAVVSPGAKRADFSIMIEKSASTGLMIEKDLLLLLGGCRSPLLLLPSRCCRLRMLLILLMPVDLEVID